MFKFLCFVNDGWSLQTVVVEWWSTSCWRQDCRPIPRWFSASGQRKTWPACTPLPATPRRLSRTGPRGHLLRSVCGRLLLSWLIVRWPATLLSSFPLCSARSSASLLICWEPVRQQVLYGEINRSENVKNQTIEIQEDFQEAVLCGEGNIGSRWCVCVAGIHH